MFERPGKYLKVASDYFLYSLSFYSFNSKDKLEPTVLLPCCSAIPVPTVQFPGHGFLPVPLTSHCRISRFASTNKELPYDSSSSAWTWHDHVYQLQVHIEHFQIGSCPSSYSLVLEQLACFKSQVQSIPLRCRPSCLWFPSASDVQPRLVAPFAAYTWRTRGGI